ncbi:MAG: hypothetical protein ACYCY8_03630 [Burkholderiales bacterium]
MTIELYGGAAPPGIAELLLDAMGHYGETEMAEAKLLDARKMAPGSLAVHFSLYKFYFYKKRLVDAERIAREALIEAANQGGFDPNWENLDAASADWTNEAAHFYLFSLKALAFIRLRQGDESGCERILDKLEQLDCNDSVGASVIRDIAAGAH